MNILIVSKNNYENENYNGITKIVHNLISGLKRINVNVEFYGYLNNTRSPTVLEKKGALLKKIFSTKPVAASLDRFSKNELINLINKQHHLYDYIHLIGPEFGCLLVDIDESNSNKIIFSMVDSISLHFKTRMHNEKKLLYKAALFVEYIRGYIYEYNIGKNLNRLKSITFVANKDANSFSRNKANKKVTVIPNGVDITKFCPSNKVNRFTCPPYNLIYTGNMDYYPNHAAALILVDLFQGNNEYCVEIVGANPRSTLINLGSENIKIVGRIDNMTHYLQRADIYVSPIMTGSGIKNKILEAMAVGMCVVGTEISFDGIAGINNFHYFRVDDTNKIPEVISGLSKTAVKEIGDNARILIEEKYSWESVVFHYKNLYST